MKNIRFNYLYRDASNFKKWGCIVFSNPQELTPAQILDQITKAIPDSLFIADQIRLPELFIYNEEPMNPDDHCFHEFFNVEESDKDADDPHCRTITNFIAELEGEQQSGWCVYDPWERAHEQKFSEQEQKMY